MPTGFLSIFSEIQDLQITNSKLKEISKENFKSFEQLSRLILDGNEIEELEENLFIFNLNLRHVSFSGNSIKIIGLNVFQNIKNLSILNLNGNICVNETANNSTEVKNLMEGIEEKCLKSIKKMEKEDVSTDIITPPSLSLVTEKIKFTSKTMKIDKITMEFNELCVENNSIVRIYPLFNITTTKPSKNLPFGELNLFKNTTESSEIEKLQEQKNQIIIYTVATISLLITLNIVTFISLCRMMRIKNQFKMKTNDLILTTYQKSEIQEISSPFDVKIDEKNLHFFNPSQSSKVEQNQYQEPKNCKPKVTKKPPMPLPPLEFQDSLYENIKKENRMTHFTEIEVAKVEKGIFIYLIF